MKQFYAILFSFIFLALACNDAELKGTKSNKEYTGNPKIEFNKTTHDFGTLKEGEIVECSFIFKNVGNSPLKILSVDADCGCTVPKYSEKEVLPGEEGIIKAVFDSNGFRNNIYKTIDVETNADSTITELVITAYIESNFNIN